MGGWNSHSQSWGFRVLRDSKRLEFDNRGQNTSHWGVLGVIGKVLKCRCPKCPRIGHLDICSPSYGQKKGYNFGLDLVLIRLGSQEIWAPKVPGLQPGQFRDNLGTPTWESREKEPFGCSPRGALQRILYGGRWWLPPSPGSGESCVSKCPWLVPTPKGVPKCELTLLWLVLDADSSLII